MRSRIISGVMVICVMACAAQRYTVQPTIPEGASHRPEDRTLPADPATEALPPETPAHSDWVEPQEAGSCVPAVGPLPATPQRPCPALAGILVGEARAARDALFRMRYVELRRNTEADRQVWTAHRTLYEERLRQAAEALERAQPTWFERHALEIGIVGGFVVGAAVTLLVESLTPVVR